MVEFLVSYWWMIFLALIIIAILTRKIIKFFIGTALLIIVIILFWSLFISSGFVKSTQCFKDGNLAQSSIYEKARLMDAGIQRNQFICSENVVEFENLVQCFRDSKRDNELGFFIYSKMPKFENTIIEIVASHNDICVSSQIVAPDF